MNRTDHPDTAAMARAVADAVLAIIVAAIDARGDAVLAIAGGSTPAAAAALLFARPLDWARVTLMPSDERWVAADDPNSNLRGLRGWLGTTPAVAARLVPLVEQPGDLAADGRHADARVAALRPLDLVWAGMGATATRFPGFRDPTSRPRSSPRAKKASSPCDPTRFRSKVRSPD